MRLRLVSCAVSLAFAACAIPVAAIADYPDRPLNLVVGAAPGSSGDFLSRLIAQRLSERLKQTVVVENKSGASGILASNDVLRSPANGYTLYVSNDSTAINTAVMKTPPPDPLKVFAPISLLARIDFKLVVNPSAPVKTVQELVAYLKASPGKYSYASSGTNSPHHLMAELFRYQADIDVLHVPYRGTAPAVTAVLSNSSLYAFSGFPAVDSFIKAGQLRALATTGTARNASSPDLPTIGETLKGFAAGSWWAMFVRSEVPADVQRRLATEVAEIIAEPDTNKRLLAAGLDPVGSTPDALRGFLAADIQKWANLPAGLINKE